jgi:hypothetical protein
MDAYKSNHSDGNIPYDSCKEHECSASVISSDTLPKADNYLGGEVILRFRRSLLNL